MLLELCLPQRNSTTRFRTRKRAIFCVTLDLTCKLDRWWRNGTNYTWTIGWLIATRCERWRGWCDSSAYCENTRVYLLWPSSSTFVSIRFWLDKTMDLSTTPRRATDGVGDLQKTRVAKSVFSIRSLVDVEEAELPVTGIEDTDRAQSEFITHQQFLWSILFPRKAGFQFGILNCTKLRRNHWLKIPKVSYRGSMILFDKWFLTYQNAWHMYQSQRIFNYSA